MFDTYIAMYLPLLLFSSNLQEHFVICKILLVHKKLSLFFFFTTTQFVLNEDGRKNWNGKSEKKIVDLDKDSLLGEEKNIKKYKYERKTTTKKNNNQSHMTSNQQTH